MGSKHGVWGLAALSVTALGTTGNAFGSGFEKTTLWSGEYNGTAGAAVSQVDGSQAIYFNPAGLIRGVSSAGDSPRAEVGVDFSPTWSRFKGPVEQDQDPISSDRRFSPITEPAIESR